MNKPQDISSAEWNEIIQVPAIRESWGLDKETAEQFAEMVYGVKFDFVSGSPVSSAKTRSDGELIEKPVIRASRLGVELSLVERSS